MLFLMNFCFTFWSFNHDVIAAQEWEQADTVESRRINQNPQYSIFDTISRHK